MMQLIVQTKFEPRIFSFDKSVVIIGTASEDIDLSFTGEKLEKEHIKIVEAEGKYLVVNIANDPFVTLNSLPFGKSKIQSGDILQIGHTLIRFQAEDCKETDIQQQSGQGGAQVIEGNHKLIKEAVERTISKSKEDSLSNIEIEDLIYEAELLAGDDQDRPIEVTISSIYENEEENFEENINTQFIDPKSSLPTVNTELGLIQNEPKTNGHPLSAQSNLIPTSIQAHEDSYIYDLEDDAGNDQEEKETNEKQKKPRNWNFWAIIFIAIAVICFIAIVGTYMTISDRSDKEKMTAAEGVADVAMALTYAQVNHIKPQKQNWSDPEFIKNNLSSVLSPEFPTFANIDNQGQFTNCPYILRVYTSTDLSQFLVIAQPEPSLLQWLIPKTAIIIDSKTMEMRNVNDLKSLNRLLVNTNNLDGANLLEIADIIKQGTLIPLSSLATHRDNPGFAPPKALALVRPGADALIYNAPRYYHFGESILNRSIGLLHTSSNSHEVTRLKQEIGELEKFPDLVLYSSQGYEKAIQAQKALATMAPHNRFLTAYLNFDGKDDLVSSYLILNEAYTEGNPSPNFAHNLNDSQISFSDHNVETMVRAPSVPALKFDGGIDYNHPLYLQLIALSKSRKQALKPISDKMIELLNNHADEGNNNFTSQFVGLWSEYKNVDKQQREKVAEVLKSLYGEYDIPLAQFAVYVKAAGLEMLAKTSLAKHAKELGGLHLTKEKIDELMEKINKSDDFLALEQNVREASDALTLTRFPDAEQLIVYQNKMRVLTLEKLRTFILAAASPLDNSAFNEENRTILSKILQAAWVNDPDEYNYYLHEYEMRMKAISDASSKKSHGR